MYKKKINNLGDQRLSKIVLNSNQNHLQPNLGWHQDSISWLKMWGIDENVTQQNIDYIKNFISSKFKEKFWCDENLEDKIKLRYYKKVINPNLEDQNYLFVLTSAKTKIRITKMKTNSHGLHSEIGHWTFP